MTTGKQQPSQRPFAVFDIDGTVIRWQLYHAIVGELGKHGHLPAEDHRQILEARHTWKSRTHSNSFTEYEETLVHIYHKALTNLKTEDYQMAVEAVFQTYKDQVYTYTRDLIRQLKRQDYWLFVISGSQQEVIQKLGDYYGFDEVVGTIYEQRDGHFTGQRREVYGHKSDLLGDLIEKYQLSFKDSLAVGDTASDIDMLNMVENPIAFNPNKPLFDHASAKGWDIIVERKSMIYRLQQRGDSYQLKTD